MKINDFQFCSYLAVFSCWPGAQFYPSTPKKVAKTQKEKANMEDNMEVLARPFQFESEICLIWISALKVELKLGKTCCL